MKTFFINEQNAENYAAEMAAWIKEKVASAHRNGVVVGMSGGIDCSVVARLCQLGGVDVLLVLMPYGDDMKDTHSSDHAIELIKKYNFSYHVFNIQPAVDALSIPEDLLFNHSGISHVLPVDGASTLPEDSQSYRRNVINIELSRANIRPRMRMIYLYQLAQLNNYFVIGTSNLSERTVGYFTKWGDGVSDLNPLAKLTKQEVYTLARYLEVPDCIIEKKPSAGLWNGQTDEAELGMTYAQIDAFIIDGASGNPEIDRKIEERIAMSAHKHAPIPIFTSKSS